MAIPRILVLNPGSTSTKIAVFDGREKIFSEAIEHSLEDLQVFKKFVDQKPLRAQAISEALARGGIAQETLTCVVGRGGMVHPVPGGTYTVNTLMVEELAHDKYGEHASNLGPQLAWDIATPLGLPCYMADPPMVDEMEPLARYSGLPQLPRKSQFHALNQKAIAKCAADDLGIPYDQAHFIVAHVGGGVSVAAHCRGRIIDVNNALDGDGPFSAERSGGVPGGGLVDLCFSGTFTLPEIKKLLARQGGLLAYLGTNSGKEVVARIEAGDEKARECYQAMAYQVAKDIGAQATVLRGKIDAIVLTGGLMFDPLLRGWIVERVAFLGKVLVYPGEDEMTALASAGLRVLEGKEKAQEYV